MSTTVINSSISAGQSVTGIFAADWVMERRYSTQTHQKKKPLK